MESSSSSSCSLFTYYSDAAGESSPTSAAHIGTALVDGVARLRRSEPASICDGRVRSGWELLHRVAALSIGLRSALGLIAGDRVAIAALNSDLYLEWLLAVPCAGSIIAPLNYRWSSHEALHAARQIDPVCLVVDKHCTPLGLEVKKHMPTITLIALGDAEGEESIPGTAYVNAASIYMGLTEKVDLPLFLAPGGIALICFTSGTTGMPKGAAITHSALIIQSLAKIQVVQYSSSDVYLHTSPLCHIGGISSAHAMVLAGGCHIFQPRFQASAVLNAIRQHQVTAMITVPTMLMDLTSIILSRREGDVEWSIRTILNGAGSLSITAFEKAVKAFPAAHLLSAYGMTEACSSMSFMTLNNPRLHTTAQYSKDLNIRMSKRASHGYCVGKPASHVELRIRPELCGSSAGSRSFEEGSILVKGPHMMKKYWGSSEHTTFDDSGWFDTGDVGWMDELGRLWLLGRKKDVVKSGGENVYCCEVEDILSRHPGITGVAVVGVKDTRLGEMVGAAILLKQGWNWEEEALLNRGTDGHLEYATASGTEAAGVLSPSLLRLHCRQQGLSRFKAPKVWMLQSTPFAVTSSGKVRKDMVREELNMYYHKKQQNMHSKL